MHVAQVRLVPRLTLVADAVFGTSVRNPYENASTVVARTQPEVMQPVTITVSRCAAVSSEQSGVRGRTTATS